MCREKEIYFKSLFFTWNREKELEKNWLVCMLNKYSSRMQSYNKLIEFD